MRSSVHRFTVLDGLRGVAAVAVVLYHIGTASGARWLAPRGYLAVDFFFVLSGFVLAHAYGERLDDGRLTARGFLFARYRRLWPTALLGATIGLVVILTTPSNGAMRSAPGFALVAILNLLLLPNPVPGIEGLYPLNPPHWSLLHELVANYVYAILAPVLRTRALATIVLFAGIGLGVATARSHGGNSLTLWRVAYSFFTGVLIYRLWKQDYRPAASMFGLALILLVALLVPIGAHPELVDSCLTLIVFPLVVWHGASTRLQQWAARAAQISGAISYPLYAIHYPFIMLIFSLA
jgi:peptidoglycan/LPS O-acetylase OafA/YrhL